MFLSGSRIQSNDVLGEALERQEQSDLSLM